MSVWARNVASGSPGALATPRNAQRAAFRWTPKYRIYFCFKQGGWDFA